MKSKVAVYVRVSTLDQEKGLESQEKAIRDYLDGHGIVDAEWYRDRVSGAKDKRPGLDRLQRDIFNGKVKTVVCWKLDRLTRKGARDGINLLGKWLESGVRVVSVTEQFDFYGDFGEVISALLFAIARMYRTSLIENTKRGLQRAKERGVKLGKRPGKWTKQIKPLLDEGLNVSQVARRLGRSRQGVADAMKREGLKATPANFS